MAGSPSSADDITQDVLVEFLRSPDRFDPARGSLPALRLGLVRNLALERWRTEHRFEPLDPLDDDTLVAAPIDLDSGEIGDIVGRAVRALPPLQREALIFAEYEGLTLVEIARAVDADVGTVKSRLHRARENLRRTLAPLRSQWTAR